MADTVTHAPCPTYPGQWFHKSTGACTCGAGHDGALDVMLNNPEFRVLRAATMVCYRVIEAGDERDSEVAYAHLTATFAKHGLDADIAESAIDWLDGGVALLDESLADALARRAA